MVDLYSEKYADYTLDIDGKKACFVTVPVRESGHPHGFTLFLRFTYNGYKFQIRMAGDMTQVDDLMYMYIKETNDLLYGTLATPSQPAYGGMRVSSRNHQTNEFYKVLGWHVGDTLAQIINRVGVNRAVHYAQWYLGTDRDQTFSNAVATMACECITTSGIIPFSASVWGLLMGLLVTSVPPFEAIKPELRPVIPDKEYMRWYDEIGKIPWTPGEKLGHE